MDKRSYKTFLTYLGFSSFILAWWCLAFQKHDFSSLDYEQKEKFLPLSIQALFLELSPFDRDPLHHALAGQFDLMFKFIEQWQKDAETLEKKGFKGIKKLSPESYLKAYALQQLIVSKDSKELRLSNDRLLQTPNHIKPNQSLIDRFSRFLPQTYVAASFLLALAKPEEIVALPNGLRHLTHLYDSSLLKQIPLDCNQCQSEKLYLSHPQLAYVAPYSHPNTLETFRRQNIPICTSKSIEKIEDIHSVLLEVGKTSHHYIESNLLSLFIEAGLYAIDNRIQALVFNQNMNETKKFVYLCYFQQYHLPSLKSLTGQLLTRALAKQTCLSCLLDTSKTDWLVPFDKEQLNQIDPDYVIVSLPSSLKKQAQEKHYQNLNHLNASRKNQLFFVDESVQDSPTQYILLAYFDIFRAIEGMFYQ